LTGAALLVFFFSLLAIELVLKGNGNFCKYRNVGNTITCLSFFYSVTDDLVLSTSNEGELTLTKNSSDVVDGRGQGEL